VKGGETRRPYIERMPGGDDAVMAGIPPYHGALAGARTGGAPDGPAGSGRGASGGVGLGGMWPRAARDLTQRVGRGHRGQPTCGQEYATHDAHDVVAQRRACPKVLSAPCLSSIISKILNRS
jgi:hypothetical protein